MKYPKILLQSDRPNLNNKKKTNHQVTNHNVNINFKKNYSLMKSQIIL